MSLHILYPFQYYNMVGITGIVDFNFIEFILFMAYKLFLWDYNQKLFYLYFLFNHF